MSSNLGKRDLPTMTTLTSFRRKIRDQEYISSATTVRPTASLLRDEESQVRLTRWKDLFSLLLFCHELFQLPDQPRSLFSLLPLSDHMSGTKKGRKDVKQDPGLTVRKYGFVSSSCKANNQSSPNVSNSSCSNSFLCSCFARDSDSSSRDDAFGNEIFSVELAVAEADAKIGAVSSHPSASP